MNWLVVIKVLVLVGFCNAKALIRSEVDSIQSNEIPNSNHHTYIETTVSTASDSANKQLTTPNIQNFLSSPVFQSLISNLTIRNVLTDSTVQGILMNPAVQTVLSNPVVQGLLTNPQLQGLALQALISVLPRLTTPMTPAPAPSKPNRPQKQVNSTPSPTTILDFVLNGLNDILQMVQAQINRRFPNRRW